MDQVVSVENEEPKDEIKEIQLNLAITRKGKMFASCVVSGTSIKDMLYVLSQLSTMVDEYSE